MNTGPQFIAELDYETKRFNLTSLFPSWFTLYDNKLQFNAMGFNKWATEHSMSERNEWLRLLDVEELAKVIETYRLWEWTTFYARTCPAPVFHQWFTTTLPFWLSEDKFDHIGFAAWYHHANFMDKEVAFKYLKLAEQKAVLNVWAAEPLKGFTTAYKREKTIETPPAELGQQPRALNRLD